LFTAIGIASALYDRKATGRGMKIDVGMLDSQVAILENAIARHVATGDIPGPLGSRHPSIAPFAAFSTKDGHVVIAVGTDPLFAKLAESLGCPELAKDPRYASNPLRMEHWHDLHEELEVILSAHSSKAWLTRLEAAGVPCAPINNVADVMADPQVLARNMIVTAIDPDVGALKMQGNPIKLSAYEDPTTREPAPGLDADRAAILEWLGLA
jgi:CoA:oxalate CoA-transferase